MYSMRFYLPLGTGLSKMGDSVNEEELRRRRRERMLALPSEDPINDTGFAPLRGEAICHSRAGRPRAKHDWDKDGKCIFCGADQEKPPMRTCLPTEVRGELIWRCAGDQHTCEVCAREDGQSRLRPPHPFCESRTGECRCVLIAEHEIRLEEK